MKSLLQNVLELPNQCAVFWKDTQGIFQECNSQFLILAGISNKSQLIGKCDDQLPWANRAAEYARDDQYVINSGETITRIEEVTLTNKVIISHTTKTTWLRDGEIVGILGVIYDITDLIKAKSQLETINQLKTEFIQNMQHDIRTPILGILSFLSDMVEKETDISRKDNLSLIRDSAKQLYEICNDIIDFDQLEQVGSLPKFKELNLTQLISDVVSLNQPAAYQKKINLSFTIDPKISQVLKSDKHRISRILVNLIGNAIKFTEHGGTINISAKFLKSILNKHIIQLQISDTGIGMPDEKKQFIYDKSLLNKVSKRETYQGSGLGLQIVKQFVGDLNGDIEVSSETLKGTTFYINLPFEVVSKNKITQEQTKLLEINQAAVGYEAYNSLSQSDNLQNADKRVLLIEDDKLSQIIELNLLKSAGWQATLAKNIKEAMDLLNHQVFTLVISDLGLPDGSSFDMVRAIKNDPQALNYHTPFLALTAHNNHDTKLEVQRNGFIKLITKPLTKELLISFLDSFQPDKSVN